MYTVHQPIIEAYADQSAEHTHHVLRFVISTINQQFQHVPRIISDLDTTGSCRLLSDFQARSLSFLWEGRRMVYRAIQDNKSDSAALMSYLVTLPNIGMVKAGFCAQLLAGTVGCIDTHNRKLYCPTCIMETPTLPGKDEVCTVCSASKRKGWNRITRVDSKMSAKRLYAKILDYTAILAHLDCGQLWDRWCMHVAGKYPRVFRSGEAVSALHVALCCR